MADKRKGADEVNGIVKPLSVEDDFSEADTLNSIIRDLPTGEPAEEDVPGGTETPEEVRKHFVHDDGYDEPFPVPTGKRNRHKDKSRRLGMTSDTLEGSERNVLKERHPKLRSFVLSLITILLIAVILSFGLTKLLPSSEITSITGIPADGVAKAMTPVQSFFASITNSVVGYFRTLKLRSNIEEQYNIVVAENEQLVYKAMLAEELEYELSQFENMYDEVMANENLKPIVCKVIGRDDGNYFSTFSINRGTNDGIQPYMAVTLSGALIGYTEQVSSTRSTVRTIIDSDASIAALIESSRDQGTVRGTLGIDGNALCRMYYLPEDHIPRPGDTVVTSGVGMSFPKGIPIGTVRESTRSMESNKQYIVVEPQADFQHIEYVIVLRYQPAALAVEARGSAVSKEYVPLETARPYPTLRVASMRYFNTPTPSPAFDEFGNPIATPTPTPSPTPTPAPTPTPTPRRTATPAPANPDDLYEYTVVSDGPTATPSPSPSPSPTPFLTLSPDDLTVEDD